MVCIASFSREFYSEGVYNIAGTKQVDVLPAARGLLPPVHTLPDREKWDGYGVGSNDVVGYFDRCCDICTIPAKLF